MDTDALLTNSLDGTSQHLSIACTVLSDPGSVPIDIQRALADVSELGPLLCDEELRLFCKGVLVEIRERTTTLPRDDWPELADECTNALNVFGRRAEARELLAQALEYVWDQDTERAGPALLSVEATDPEGPFADVARAYRTPHIEEALQILEQSSSNWPTCAEVAIHLGLFYRKWAQLAAWSGSDEESRDGSLSPEEAREIYIPRSVAALDRAILLYPSYPFSYAARASARLLLLSGDPKSFSSQLLKQIEGDLKQALELDLSSHYALTTYAEFKRRLGNDEEAIVLFDRVLALPALNKGGRFFALRQKAATLLHLKKRKEAEPFYRDALVMDPNNVFCLLGIARICLDTDPKHRAEEALKYTEAALKIQINNPQAMFQQAKALKILQRNEEALSILRQLLDWPKARNLQDQVRTILAQILQTNNAIVEAYYVLNDISEQKRHDKRIKSQLTTLRERVPYEISSLVATMTPKVKAGQGLSEDEEKSLMIAASLHPRVAVDAIILATEARLSQRRTAEALDLLRRIPRTFQSPTVQELRQRVRKMLRLEFSAASAPMRAGVRVSFPRGRLTGTQVYELSLIEDFLQDMLERDKLPIAEVIKQADEDGHPIGGPDPIFLKAATGVGKTVAVPLHVYIQLVRELSSEIRGREIRDARVYVVEPRIAIAENEAVHLNETFFAYLKRQGHSLSGSAGIFGSITSATGRQNADAPVVFITTGVFESMTQNIDDRQLGLSPRLHRVIIDEAHVTLPNNPGIEVAIALCRRKRILVDYMSATVDDAGLFEMLGVQIIDATTRYVRYPIEYRPTGKPLIESLVPIVEKYLVRRDDISEALRAHDSDEPPDRRAIGMLVVVNSHQSENSDTLRYFRILEDYRRESSSSVANGLEIRRLASPVLRNAVMREQFEAWKQQIERRASNGESPRYVIIATNVVEMGVTFPSLDFVVSMDTEIVTEEGIEGAKIRKVPISVSALTQRAGRFGRRRPGMCFLTKEEDSIGEHLELSDLDAASLRLRLQQPEHLRPPLSMGSLDRIALLSFADRAASTSDWNLLEFLPSANAGYDNFIDRLGKARRYLIESGLAHGNSLTSVGRQVLSLIQCGDIRFARLYASAPDQSLVIPFAVIMAAGDTSLSDLIHPHRILGEGGGDEKYHRSRRKGARLLIEESIGDLQGPDVEVLSLGVDSELATGVLSAGGAEGIAELLRHGLGIPQAATIARYLARDFAVVDWREIVEPEPQEPEQWDEWTYLQERARKKIHFVRELVTLDQESDLLSLYLLVSTVLRDYNDFFAENRVPEYVWREIAAYFDDDMRAAELRPREVSTLLRRCLEIMGSVELPRNAYTRFTQAPLPDREAIEAITETAVLTANVDMGFPLPPPIVLPAARALANRITSTSEDKPRKALVDLVREETEDLDETVDLSKMEYWSKGILTLAERYAQQRLRRFRENETTYRFPLLTSAMRNMMLVHLRTPPLYGDELILERNGYGNYEAQKMIADEIRIIELSTSRTSVRLKGEYIHVIGRLRPGIRRVIRPDQGREPVEEPILTVTHITVLRQAVESGDALNHMAALGLASSIGRV